MVTWRGLSVWRILVAVHVIQLCASSPTTPTTYETLPKRRRRLPLPLRSILTSARWVLDNRPVCLSDTFGSVTRASAFERVESQPVFQVTTPSGAPYLVLEPDDEKGGSASDDGDEMKKLNALRDQHLKMRQVAPYFMDYAEALALRDEMLSVKQLAGSDMRITTTSLGRALRQSSFLGRGMLSGQPIDDLTGRVRDSSDGGTVRYKIVPPKRELFYAARCLGRERVGLFSDRPELDAELMLQIETDIGKKLASLRQSKSTNSFGIELRDLRRDLTRGEDAGPKEYQHMKGYLGIPVFYCPSLRRRDGMLRSLRGDAQVPLFFSYDDLVHAWKKVKNKVDDDKMPSDPPNVEVFNLMDVVTSIDRDQWQQKNGGSPRRWKFGLSLGAIPGFKRPPGSEMSQPSGEPVGTLQKVTFVPSSLAYHYKEKISAAGNGKARLRPMKRWGYDAM